MNAQIWVRVGLTLVVIFGGSVIAMDRNQSVEVKGAAIAIVGGAVGWWFKSPLEE